MYGQWEACSQIDPGRNPSFNSSDRASNRFPVNPLDAGVIAPQPLQPVLPDCRDNSANLARTTLAAFVATFIAARCLVYLIMARRIPDLYLHLGGTHVHHLNYGIFLLSIVCAYLLFAKSSPSGRHIAALAYGVGLALTFDEFGMWLHLGGSYWQRASFDAVIAVAALLALIANGPKLSRYRPRNWWFACVLFAALVVFVILLMDSLRWADRKLEPAFERLEKAAPR